MIDTIAQGNIIDNNIVNKVSKQFAWAQQYNIWEAINHLSDVILCQQTQIERMQHILKRHGLDTTDRTQQEIHELINSPN